MPEIEIGRAKPTKEPEYSQIFDTYISILQVCLSLQKVSVGFT